MGFWSKWVHSYREMWQTHALLGAFYYLIELLIVRNKCLKEHIITLLNYHSQICSLLAVHLYFYSTITR